MSRAETFDCERRLDRVREREKNNGGNNPMLLLREPSGLSAIQLRDTIEDCRELLENGDKD